MKTRPALPLLLLLLTPTLACDANNGPADPVLAASSLYCDVVWHWGCPGERNPAWLIDDELLFQTATDLDLCDDAGGEILSEASSGEWLCWRTDTAVPMAGCDPAYQDLWDAIDWTAPNLGLDPAEHVVIPLDC